MLDQAITNAGQSIGHVSERGRDVQAFFEEDARTVRVAFTFRFNGTLVEILCLRERPANRPTLCGHLSKVGNHLGADTKLLSSREEIALLVRQDAAGIGSLCRAHGDVQILGTAFGIPIAWVETRDRLVLCQSFAGIPIALSLLSLAVNVGGELFSGRFVPPDEPLVTGEFPCLAEPFVGRFSISSLERLIAFRDDFSPPGLALCATDALAQSRRSCVVPLSLTIEFLRLLPLLARQQWHPP